jgi:hypothetical protein
MKNSEIQNNMYYKLKVTIFFQFTIQIHPLLICQGNSLIHPSTASSIIHNYGNILKDPHPSVIVIPPSIHRRALHSAPPSSTIDINHQRCRQPGKAYPHLPQSARKDIHQTCFTNPTPHHWEAKKTPPSANPIEENYVIGSLIPSLSASPLTVPRVNGSPDPKN